MAGAGRNARVVLFANGGKRKKEEKHFASPPFLHILAGCRYMGSVFAQNPVHESLDFNTVGLGEFADAFFFAFYERLFHQHSFSVEVSNPTLDHLIDNILGLSFGQRGFAKNLAFILDGLLIQVVDRQAIRTQCGNMHADVAQFGRIGPSSFQQDTMDGGAGVKVGGTRTVNAADPTDIENFSNSIE